MWVGRQFPMKPWDLFPLFREHWLQEGSTVAEQKTDFWAPKRLVNFRVCYPLMDLLVSCIEYRTE